MRRCPQKPRHCISVHLRKAATFATKNEFQAYSVTSTVHASPAAATRLKQSLILIEPDGPGGEIELLGKIGDRIGGRIEGHIGTVLGLLGRILDYSFN